MGVMIKPVGVLVAVGLVACGGEKEEPQSQYNANQPGQYQPQQQYPQQQGQYPQQQQPPPQQQQQPPPAQTAQSPIPMQAPPAGQAQPVDATVLAPVQPVLTQLGQSEAPPGAQPLGSVVAGNFSAGSAMEHQFQAEPGKCYTVVGAGLGVTELNLQLVAVTPLPTMSPILAEDKTTGPQAVLGKNPNCYKWAAPFPAPVKLVITAAAGQGIAGAQIFQK